MMKMLDEIKTLKLTCEQMKKEEVDDSPVDGSYPKGKRSGGQGLSIIKKYINGHHVQTSVD